VFLESQSQVASFIKFPIPIQFPSHTPTTLGQAKSLLCQVKNIKTVLETGNSCHSIYVTYFPRASKSRVRGKSTNVQRCTARLHNHISSFIEPTALGPLHPSAGESNRYPYQPLLTLLEQKYKNWIGIGTYVNNWELEFSLRTYWGKRFRKLTLAREFSFPFPAPRTDLNYALTTININTDDWFPIVSTWSVSLVLHSPVICVSE
jgi:hypothetical protein